MGHSPDAKPSSSGYPRVFSKDIKTDHTKSKNTADTGFSRVLEQLKSGHDYASKKLEKELKNGQEVALKRVSRQA